MTATILIATPIAPSTPATLRHVNETMVADMIATCTGIVFEVARDDAAIVVPDAAPRYSRHAAARNHLIDTRLTPEHDYVLWVDADVIAAPPTLPRDLLAHGGIAAPLVLLDHCGDRFYDIGGFLERGARANLYPPYWTQPGPVVTLDSVGCVYLIPAWLYRAGLRYAPPPHGHPGVEHWSVMCEAAALDVPIVADMRLTALHAWLPDFGLELHAG